MSSNEISPTVMQELVDATWGLALLVLGLFGQTVRNWGAHERVEVR
jgi:hypothetical protein